MIHGRSGWMHGGCRCKVCHAGLLRYARDRRAVHALRRGGSLEVRVPVGPVRRHVAKLRRQGWTVRQIAERAGVSYSSVDRIANRARRVAWSTARAVLAVEG